MITNRRILPPPSQMSNPTFYTRLHTWLSHHPQINPSLLNSLDLDELRGLTPSLATSILNIDHPLACRLVSKISGMLQHSPQNPPPFITGKKPTQTTTSFSSRRVSSSPPSSIPSSPPSDISLLGTTSLSSTLEKRRKEAEDNDMIVDLTDNTNTSTITSTTTTVCVGGGAEAKSRKPVPCSLGELPLDTPASSSTLKPGTYVTLHSLTTSSLNYSRGTIVGVNKSGRYKVYIDGSSIPKLIKGENLRVRTEWRDEVCYVKFDDGWWRGGSRRGLGTGPRRL